LFYQEYQADKMPYRSLLTDSRRVPTSSPIKITDSLDKLAKMYVQEIVRLHGVPVSIVSNRDPQFTSKFRERLQKAMGTKLNFNTAYYPLTDS
jgi:hypothetical protein